MCAQISQKVGEKVKCTCQSLQKSLINDWEHDITKGKGIDTTKIKNSQCCSCKKSHCLKKYCLCFSANRQCSA